MKKIFVIGGPQKIVGFFGAAIASLIILSVGVAISEEELQAPIQQPPTAQIDARFQAANEWLNQNNLSVTTSPEQAFVNDYLLVYAEGLPLPTATTPAKKRLTAIEAAKTLAYRNLAEILDGVAVVGDTLVRDAELQYDVVRKAVTGFVKGAKIVYQKYDDAEGSAIVMLKVGMSGPRGFGSMMYEKLVGDPNVKKTVAGPEKPSFKPVQPATLDERYDGLIIDATPYSFRPALINRIFTPKGEVIYDPSKISQKVLVESGCGEYTNSVDKAKAALSSRGVNNPLIVTASASVSSSDLQVSEDDAARIFTANQKSNFFAEAKVAFVLK